MILSNFPRNVNYCYCYQQRQQRRQAIMTSKRSKWNTRVVQKVLSLTSFYPRYILKWFTALEWCVEKLTIPFHFVKIAFQLTELFQIEIDAVIYTDQLLHWNMDQKTGIRSYIKCRIRLNIDSKQIFNELCGIYGPQTISTRTVFRWVKLLKLGNFLLKMIPVLEGLKPLLPRLTSLL